MNLLANPYDLPAFNFEVGILTPREIEVIKRILLPSKNIAFDLNISEHTVNAHLTNIKNKTGMVDKYHMAYFLGTRQGSIN